MTENACDPVHQTEVKADLNGNVDGVLDLPDECFAVGLLRIIHKLVLQSSATSLLNNRSQIRTTTSQFGTTQLQPSGKIRAHCNGVYLVKKVFAKPT